MKARAFRLFATSIGLMLFLSWNVGCGDEPTDPCTLIDCGTKKCVGGICESDCTSGLTGCGDGCVDTKTSAKHCGACNQACKEGETCKDGKCSSGCKEDETLCDKTCTNTKTDKANCGACGTACGEGEVCSDGTCGSGCKDGKTDCSGSCVDLKTDKANCGTCGTACKDGEACKEGSCESACSSGETVCSGKCVDLQGDTANCGSCGKACNSGEVCAAGVCGSSCPTGQTDCSGKCVDLQTDKANCGKCGEACKAGESCAGGACSLVCPTDKTKCGTSCVDTKTDSSNCGNCGTQCSAGEQCVAGSCACPTGKKDCSGTCIDVLADRNHCGACGNACKAGEVCSQGKCELSCPATQTNCGGSCVDTKTDSQHCGSCGSQCSNGKVCASGSCACSTGQTDCNGTCVNAQTDNNNCGSCGTKCSGGKRCSAGACVCPTGQTDCNGACVNVQTDVSHCGACGKTCPSGQTCTSGQCEIVCQSGQTKCNNICVNLQSDSSNCGSCGTKCFSGSSCRLGVCACSVGLTRCGNTCVNTQLDNKNCGGCNRVCSSSQTCSAGKCATSNWVATGGTTSADYGYGVAVDSKGNVYVTGFFQGTATFGTTTLAGKGDDNMFVAKYDSTGRFVRAVNVVNGGTTSSYDSIGYAIAVDSKDNVYVTGSFYGTTTIAATFGRLTLKSKGSRDVFVAKLDPNLNFVKVFGGGTTSNDYGYGIALDKNDNVFVSGFFASASSGATFGTKTLKSYGSTDAFVLKLNKDLVYQNAVNLGGSSGSDVAHGVVTDSQNNVYVTGYWNTGSTGATVLSFRGGTVKGSKYYDMFVAKLTNNLAFTKVVAAKGGAYHEYPRGITVDKYDNLYVTGYWSTNTATTRTCSFGRYVLTNNGSSSSSYDVFVTKLDKNLTFTGATNLGTTGADIGYGIASDGTNVYVSGYTGAALKVGSRTLPYKGGNDIFVVKYSSTLTPLAGNTGGGSGSDFGYGIAADPAGNFYLSGHLSTGAVLGGKTYSSRGSYDVFVTKNLP
ncbi:MAG: hypothetical protein EP343_09525 [Deltaproteobacteria bacterium]|nr:MAG: hypothetical protein EP343_09525 [Deltaproteobacteria bacterium]